jgi:hypothetical protein
VPGLSNPKSLDSKRQKAAAAAAAAATTTTITTTVSDVQQSMSTWR